MFSGELNMFRPTRRYKIKLLKLVRTGKAEIQKRKGMEEADENENHCLHKKLFQETIHFMDFATKIYLASRLFLTDNLLRRRFELQQTSDVLFKCFEDPTGLFHPDFAIIRDRKHMSFVIVIRGTFDTKDLFIDFDCSEAPFLSGKAHNGILIGAEEILKKAKPILIKAMTEEPHYKLVITGHSLGAGTAELITMMILSNKGENSVLVRHKVRCIALAPPPVYRSDQKLPNEIIDSIKIYINNNDCVPSLSLGTVRRYLAAMWQIDRLELENNTDNDMNKVIQAIEDAENEDIPYLQHPGQIFHMDYNGTRHSYNIRRRLSEDFAASITISFGMVISHLWLCYKIAFMKVQKICSPITRGYNTSYNWFFKLLTNLQLFFSFLTVLSIPRAAELFFPYDFGFKIEEQGGNSQNFLSKFVRFFITLGLKILRLQ